MPQIEYTVRIAAPVERVWAFVEHLPNWAPLMIGYQKLEEITDRQSIWTLKGDVGVLSREVDLQADITVWEPLDRVEFTLTGLTEKISGGGVFTLRPDNGGTPSGDAGDAEAGDGKADAAATGTTGGANDSAPVTVPSQPARGTRAVVQRFFAWVLHRVMNRSEGAAASVREAAASVAAVSSSTDGDAGAGAGADKVGSLLTFNLSLKPGGPMAPMIELLMAPMLEPAATDLASGIRDALEATA